MKQATTTEAPEAKSAPTMSQQLRKHREKYVKTLGVANRGSMDNDDAIAQALRGKEPEQVIALAEKLTKLTKGTLTKRYANLNPGQRSMNARNIIRNAVKRGDITAKQIK